MRAFGDSDLLVFVDGLRIATEADVPLPEIFDRLAESSPGHAARFEEGARLLRSGAPLSVAAEEVLGSSRSELASVLRAGERAGAPALPLRSYARELDRRIERRRRTAASLTYPVIVFASLPATLIAFAYLARGPRLQLVGGPLPSAISGALLLGGLILPLLGLLAVPGVLGGRFAPGGLRRLEAKARAFHTLDVLLRAGVPLTESLRVAAEALPREVAAALRASADQIASGVPFVDALPDPLLSPVERVLLSRPGSDLRSTLGRLAASTEEDVSLRERESGVLLGIAISLVTGIVAGTFVVACWSAYFRMFSELPF